MGTIGVSVGALNLTQRAVVRLVSVIYLLRVPCSLSTFPCSIGLLLLRVELLLMCLTLQVSLVCLHIYRQTHK